MKNKALGMEMKTYPYVIGLSLRSQSLYYKELSDIIKRVTNRLIIREQIMANKTVGEVVRTCQKGELGLETQLGKRK